ncbi:MAG: FkbM family methyltransferase [Pseudomonadota bacterium]
MSLSALKGRVNNLLRRYLDLEIVDLSRKHSGGGPGVDLLGLILRERSSRVDRKLRVLQIGANDGLTGDPLRALIVDDLVEAVLVEPLPSLCDGLRELYADNPDVRIVESAVAAKAGTAEIYVALRADGAFADSKVSSFDPAHVADHIDRRRAIEPELFGEAPRVGTREVDVITPETLLANSGWTSADALIVDAEGLDAEIVSFVLDFDLDIAVIQFESSNIENGVLKELDLRLASEGYLSARSGQNTIAIREDEA